MRGKIKGGEKSSNQPFLVIPYAALMLMFLLGFWLATMPSAHAQSLHGLSFDGNHDFAVVSFPEPGAEFSQMTLQVWVKPEQFDPPRETFAGWVRAVSQLPPNTGFTKTKDSILLLYQDKSDWTRWGFYVSAANSDGSPAWESDVMATTYFDRQQPDRWYHLAVTFDGSTGTIILYQDGAVAAIRNSLPPGVKTGKFLSLWFGRWVAATISDMGLVAIHNRVLTQTEIQDNMTCGVTFEGLFAYWPFNEGSGHTIADVSGNNHDGFLGDSRINDRSEPQWVAADYLTASVDIDGDGIADNCDNCVIPSSPAQGYNPFQEDRDKDEYGDACDRCPQYANSDTDGDGWADRCGNNVVTQSESYIDGTDIVTKTTWVGPDGYWIPPDCNNTLIVCCTPRCLDDDGYLIEANVLPRNCRRIVPYRISVLEGDVEGYGNPSGDVEPVAPDNYKTNRCNLLEWYQPSILAQAKECTAIYINYLEDRGLNYQTGECEDEVCVNPDDPKQIFIGESQPDDTPVPVQLVDINIKPFSFPNNINLSGGGTITVAIFTTDLFDAAQVDPTTVTLRGSQGLRSCSPWKAEVKNVANQGICDPEYDTCNPDDLPDILLHYNELCLEFVAGDTKAILEGRTYPDAHDVVTNILGFDSIVVR